MRVHRIAEPGMFRKVCLEIYVGGLFPNTDKPPTVVLC